MKPIIRPYTISDRNALLDLIDSVAGEGSYLPVAGYSSTPEWEAALAGEAERTLILLAECESKLVGWCRLFPKGDGAAELGIGLLAHYRGKGIGGELLRRCVEWARDTGYSRIVLDTMESNSIARNFFPKHGFTETGRASLQIGDGAPYEAILMELEL